LAKWPPSPKKQDGRAPRKPGTERLLCEAVGQRYVLELQYEDDMHWREFEPHCVYVSRADETRINVFGELTKDRDKTNPRLGIRSFEIGKIWTSPSFGGGYGLTYPSVSSRRLS
jgi:hypothetical protein